MRQVEDEKVRRERVLATVRFVQAYQDALIENKREIAEGVANTWALIYGYYLFPTVNRISTPGGIIELREVPEDQKAVDWTMTQLEKWVSEQVKRLNLEDLVGPIETTVPYGGGFSRRRIAGD